MERVAGVAFRLTTRFAIALLALATVAAASLWAGQGLVSALSESRAWVRQPDFTQTTRTAEDLFKAALTEGVIWVEPQGPQLLAQPCEALYQAELAVSRPGGLGTRARLTLDRLCTSPAGQQILNELLAWNASFLLAGVRDSRVSLHKCANGDPADTVVIQSGCNPAQWTASVIAAGLNTELPLGKLPGAAPPPRDFVDFATGSSKLMSDWALFGPPTGDGETVRLDGLLPARTQRLVVDVLLDISRITLGRDSAVFDRNRDELRFPFGNVTVTAERICPEDTPQDTCAQAMAAQVPGGWRLVLNGPARAADLPLRLEGVPVRTTPELLRPLPAGERARDGTVRLWRSAHIEVSCRRTGSARTRATARAEAPEAAVAPVCEAGWREPVRRERGGAGGAVLFADGQQAIAADGKPAALVDELGLTPLLGHGPGDVGSLAGSLGTMRSRGHLHLTLDPTLQKLADASVSEHMTTRLGRGTRPRRPGPLVDDPERSVADLGAGRAALVLMDAGDEPGALLAIAGWPRLRGGMNAWDLQALSAGNPTESPLAGHGWRAGDVHAMPGSTFKLATGLAGIMSLPERPELADILSGRMAPAEQQRSMGIGAAELLVDGTPLRNYAGAGFGSAVLPPGRGASGCPPARPGGQIGVCEALIKSSNLWFGGLALALDSRRIGRPGTQPERTGTWLAQATRHFFPIVEAGAGPDRVAAITRELDMLRGMVPGATRLVAEPLELAVEDRRNAGRIALVTNAYGQGVRASPLAMATIYGSVGAGRILRPRLLYPVLDAAEFRPAHEGLPLFPGLTPQQAAEWRQRLEAGLLGVSNSSYGTAARVMASVPAELRQRIHGKTGTADTVPGMNSAWFAGWIDNIAGRRRVAFACWISHTRDTGGAACGSLIARLVPKLAAVVGRRP
jgi:cell division protein FtsI/penicillin-binding protein 2